MALLCLTACLLFAIPHVLAGAAPSAVDPLTKMTGAMQAIQEGHTDVRMPENSDILEVREIFKTVNAMLDTISQQKINSYEQELKYNARKCSACNLQNQASLLLKLPEQDLFSGRGKAVFPHTGARPGPFAYFRNIFKDGSQLIPLEVELNSVGSYIRLQQVGQAAAQTAG